MNDHKETDSQNYAPVEQELVEQQDGIVQERLAPVNGGQENTAQESTAQESTGQALDEPETIEIEQRGLFYEEFKENVKYLHRPGRTASEADNVLFTTLTMNTQALHLDAAFSNAQKPFGQRLMNSMWTLSTMVGISVTQLTMGTLVAQLGLDGVAFKHPLFIGDTLYTESVIREKRLSASRPGSGIVVISHIGRNQDGVEVARATRTVLVQMQPTS